jgi:hypothetical protein
MILGEILKDPNQSYVLSHGLIRCAFVKAIANFIFHHIQLLNFLVFFQSYCYNQHVYTHKKYNSKGIWITHGLPFLSYDQSIGRGMFECEALSPQ